MKLRSRHWLIYFQRIWKKELAKKWWPFHLFKAVLILWHYLWFRLMFVVTIFPCVSAQEGNSDALNTDIFMSWKYQNYYSTKFYFLNKTRTEALSLKSRYSRTNMFKFFSIIKHEYFYSATMIHFRILTHSEKQKRVFQCFSSSWHCTLLVLGRINYFFLEFSETSKLCLF